MNILVSLAVECVKSIKICNYSCNLCSFCWFSEKGFEEPGVQKYILAFLSELLGATRHLHFFCSMSPHDIGVKAATAKNWICTEQISLHLIHPDFQTCSIMFCVLKTPNHSDSLVSLGCKQCPFNFITSVLILLTSSYHVMLMTKLVFLISQHR